MLEDTDSDDFDSESTSGSMDSLTTISASEEASWYTTKHGRLYHTMPSIYCLPADDIELARLKLQHDTIKLAKNDYNYLPPMGEILRRPNDGALKRVVDIGSGSGIWIEEMCAEFPDVRFIGIDIVPAATKYPPENARFECYNVEEDGLRNADASIDVVHVRMVCSFIQDMPRFIADIARVLKPGGLVVLIEMDPVVKVASGESLATAAPIFQEFWTAVLTTCRDYGTIDLMIVSKLQTFLGESGMFTDIELRSNLVPIGPWNSDPRLKQVGEIAIQHWKELARALGPVLLLNPARTEQQVTSMIDAFINYLDNSGDTQILTCYHTISAVKKV